MYSIISVLVLDDDYYHPFLFYTSVLHRVLSLVFFERAHPSQLVLTHSDLKQLLDFLWKHPILCSIHHLHCYKVKQVDGLRACEMMNGGLCVCS